MRRSPRILRFAELAVDPEAALDAVALAIAAEFRDLPILLSVVYVEAARRAGIELAGVGLGSRLRNRQAPPRWGIAPSRGGRQRARVDEWRMNRQCRAS
jgi:hypothetical protein